MSSDFIVNVVANRKRKADAYKPVLRLVFSRDSIRLSDLIERRVLAEIDAYEANKNSTSSFVQLDKKELELDKALKDGEVGRSKAVQQAFDEFEMLKYIVIINNHQVLSLDEDIPLRRQMEVTFFELPSLLGG